VRRKERRVIGPDGVGEIIVRGFARASELGKYSAAVDRYISTGDASGLRRSTSARAFASCVSRFSTKQPGG
jgi:hypothetical protein